MNFNWILSFYFIIKKKINFSVFNIFYKEERRKIKKKKKKRKKKIKKKKNFLNIF